MGDRAEPLHLPPAGDGVTDPQEWVAFGPTDVEPEPRRNQRNYRITDADRLGAGSLKRKCQDNLAAIALLKRLEGEGRSPTPDEQRVLVRFIGWGGLPQVFDPWNDDWKSERERLEQLLTPEELESARATTLNAHYTAPVVIGAMYTALQRLGFTHGRILEPACGLGHFIGLMPDEMHGLSHITGIEIDSVTARLFDPSSVCRLRGSTLMTCCGFRSRLNPSVRRHPCRGRSRKQHSAGSKTMSLRPRDADIWPLSIESGWVSNTEAALGGAAELWTIKGGHHVPTLSAQFAPEVIDWLLAHPKP